MRRLIVISIIILVILAGCISSIRNADEYADQYSKGLNRTSVYNPDDLADCELGNCSAMVCVHGEHFISSLTSYIGGHCYIKENLTHEEFNDMISQGGTNKIALWPFMIGQGSSIGEFDLANPYCSNRLKMAVHWLMGDEDVPYDMPEPNQALCLLGYGVMPVYVLYSESKNADPQRVREIVQELAKGRKAIIHGTLKEDHVGPVIIIPELEYNETVTSEVVQMVKIINEECNDYTTDPPQIRCMVALAPKYGRIDLLDEVLNDPAVDEGHVHMVAYGINSRYMKGCSGAHLIAQAMNYSSFMLYNKSLPTLIPYVLIDAGSTDVDGSCNWHEAGLTQAYSHFFTHGIIALQKRGVLGISPYDFNSSSLGSVANPLGCVDCALGKNSQRMQAWFGGCQAFTRNMEKLQNPNIPGSINPGFYNVFATKPAGTCDFASGQISFLTQMQYPNKDIMQGATPELRPADETIKACGACIKMGVDKDPPFDIKPRALSTIDNLHGDDGVCKAHGDVIDFWAATRSLDPMFIRANIYHESDGTMDECYIARVCQDEICSGGQAACTARVPGGLCFQSYSKGYIFMEDPRSTIAGAENVCSWADPPEVNGKPLFTFVGLGMAQVLESPYTFWPVEHHPENENGPYFDPHYKEAVIQNQRPENLDVAKSCNEHFNPFNASDAMCMGTHKMAKNIERARYLILREYKDFEGHEDIFGLKDDPQRSAEKIMFLSYYIAIHKYFGDWDSKGDTRKDPEITPCRYDDTNGICWLKRFARQRGFTAEWCETNCVDNNNPPEQCSYACDGGEVKKCMGYTDFIKYVYDCEASNSIYGVDTGYTRLALYLALIGDGGCARKTCPPGQKASDDYLTPNEKQQLSDRGGIIWNVPWPEEEGLEP